MFWFKNETGRIHVQDQGRWEIVVEIYSTQKDMDWINLQQDIV